jgi:pyruvate dehydrogenase E1 component
MDALFRQVGIYSHVGQLYEPVDMDTLLYYKESTDGQILEEGINEAGSLSSFIAAGTAYSIHGVNTIPFFIYYSMFGFQRVGDLIWAAADQRSRGFLLGATAGRTTLSGEGLQHQDGSSHVVAATVPNCRAYDPAFASELAVIVDHGLHAMLERQEDVFYYLTVTNENYPQASLSTGKEADIIAGMYRIAGHDVEGGAPRVRLLGSGSIFREVLAAAELLARDWRIASDVFSVTSFSELAREARETQRWNRLHPGQAARRSHVARLLEGNTPVVAATDYVRALPQLIVEYIEADFTALGTDGFGRSDTRAVLRRFFEVDRHHVVVAALHALARAGSVPVDLAAGAIERFGIDVDAAAPWTR